MSSKSKRRGVRRKSASLNAAHEKFAQRIALGDSQGEAVRKAYPAYKSKTQQAACERGSKLMAMGKIQTRVAELSDKVRAKANDDFEITADKVLKQMVLLGFSNVLDYMKATADGGLVADFSTITRDKAAAIQSVEVEQIRGKRLAAAAEDAGIPDDAPATMMSVKFKLGDKRAALVEIGKMIGMFDKGDDGSTKGVAAPPRKPKGTGTETTVNKAKNDIDLARRAVFLLANAAKNVESASK